jgi:trehalose/maltose transport system substrate-binding protein
LNLRWEWRFDLAELSYPAASTSTDLESYSAVQLFLRLMRQTAYPQPIEGEEMLAAARICRLLGGIPLGIELAAARAGKLSCVTVATALERDLDALATTMRDVPARQRSLRAIFDASWQGLTPGDQQVYRRLSVFRGSFTGEAAQAVAGATLEHLIGLVDKSLLRRTSPDRAEIHPVLRHFAAEKLAESPEEQAEIFDRHETFYVAFLKEQTKRLAKGEAVAAIQAEISTEDENIWALLSRNTAGGQATSVSVILDQIQGLTHHLEFFEVQGTTNVHLDHFLKQLETQANSDYCLIDICWLGTAADHLLDLSEPLADQIEQHFSAIIGEMTVDGRLVALPRSIDFPLLYYRTDLLAKYGYAQPPATWDELERMAATIQAGERAEGRTDFWGYLWQGKNYEGLTCNALEWQASHSGGHLIETDGTINVNNPQTRMALERAAGWVGTISPPSVVEYSEPESRAIWEAGQAAFVRMWAIAFFSRRLLPDMATTQKVMEQTGATIMPRVESDHIATLGGWPAAIVKFARHPEEAITLVRQTTGYEAQLRRALEPFPLPPSIPELYDHPQVLARHPYFADIKRLIADGLVIRPSKVTGKLYPQVSRAYSNAVYSVLTGEVDATTALENLEKNLVDLTGFPVARPD